MDLPVSKLGMLGVLRVIFGIDGVFPYFLNKVLPFWGVDRPCLSLYVGLWLVKGGTCVQFQIP